MEQFGEGKHLNALTGANPATAPTLQASGSTGDASQGQFSPTVSEATKAASALSELVSGTATTALAIKEKEDFLTGYAGSGAGMGIKELRAEQPAFLSIFGASATMRGAQARQLQNAVATFGNEGLAMVDKYKDKDPAEFHKMLSSTVSKFFTGDGATDQLITQKATESIPEIAKAHYKANAEYVQKLNADTYADSIRTQLTTLSTLRGMPEASRSDESISTAETALDDLLKKPEGMTDLAHSAILSEVVVQQLHAGNSALFDKLRTSIHASSRGLATMDDAQRQLVVRQEHAKAQEEAKAKAAREGTLAEYMARVKLGDTGAELLFVPTPVEQVRIQEAYDVFDKNLREKFATQRAVEHKVLKDMVKGGAPLTEVLPRIQDFQKRLGKMTEEEQFSIIDAYVKKEKTASKDEIDLNEYLQHKENANGEKVYHALIRDKVGSKVDAKGRPLADILILHDIVDRHEPTPNKELEYEYSSVLGMPVDPKTNKKNERFDRTFAKFQAHYEIDPDSALNHIKDLSDRATFKHGMESITNQTMTADDFRSSLQSNTRVKASDIRSSPDLVSRLEDAKREITSNGWGLWHWRKKAEMTPYVENQLINTAVYQASLNGASMKDALAVSAQEMLKSHEIVDEKLQPFGKVPFQVQMGLLNKSVATDDVIEHYTDKFKLGKVRSVINNGMITMTPVTDKGLPIPSRPPIHADLRELGKVYNADVLAPHQKETLDTAAESSAAKMETAIRTEIYKSGLEGKKITREQAVENINRMQANRERIVGSTIGAAKKYLVDLPDDLSSLLKANKEAAKGVVKDVRDGVKSFWKAFMTP